MHYFLYPTKDTTLSNHPDFMFKNMGLDEILEIEKRTYQVATQSAYETFHMGTASVQLEPAFGAKDTSLSRALLHFNLTEISRSISAGTITNPKFYLSLKTAEAKEVPVYYTLAAYPLAKEWVMGTGYKYDGQGIADGASWKFAGASANKWWPEESLWSLEGGGIWYVSASVSGSGSGYAEPPFVSPNPYDPFPSCSLSSSLTGSPIPPVTGNLVCYQTFDYQTSDVRMDVTTIVNAWLSNTVPNYGLIVMHSGETDSIDYGKLRFFSKETNTIYSPHLDIGWDDSTFNTGSGSSSLEPLNIQDAVVTIKNMSAEYKHGSIIKFEVTGRKRYPIKTFTNRLSDYLEPYYLPSASFYSIRDAESAEMVIPYDFCTRLSLDETGNYFYLDTTGLPQERYFGISIRAEQSGSILTFDIPTTFKISR
jgi:hypothetical protein